MCETNSKQLPVDNSGAYISSSVTSSFDGDNNENNNHSRTGISSKLSAAMRQRRKKRTLVLLGAVAVLAVLAIAATVGVLVSRGGGGGGSSSSASASNNNNKGLEEESLDGGTSNAGGPSAPSTPAASSTAPSTLVPTISAAPTSMPSSGPTTTLAPSISGTIAPTTSPNPTAIPSTIPTATASVAPSAGPTAAPSVFPTASPAPTQGETAAPTVTPVDPELRFRIKMHWEPDFFWQEEEDERRWCAQCTRCDELNFSEFPIADHNCDDNDDRDRACRPGDQLWLRDCDDGYGIELAAVYNTVAVPGYVGVQLQVVQEDNDNDDDDDDDNNPLLTTTVCVTRTRQRYVTLQLCDSLDQTQLWKPEIAVQHEFRLVPLVFHPNDQGQEFCVTQVRLRLGDCVVCLLLLSIAMRGVICCWARFCRAVSNTTATHDSLFSSFFLLLCRHLFCGQHHHPKRCVRFDLAIDCFILYGCFTHNNNS